MIMRTGLRLVVATALVAVVASNLIPSIGVATGLLSWQEVVSNVPAFNLIFVVPAIPASILAAALYGKDPGLRSDPICLNAFGVTLVGFGAYFLMSLAWAPMLKALFPEFGLARPGHAAIVLFQTLVVGFICFLPIWALETIAVRWSTDRAVGA